MIKKVEMPLQAKVKNNNESKVELPYNIYLSTDPYNNRLEHRVQIQGSHKTSITQDFRYEGGSG